MDNITKQLCWSCAKACNKNKCVWVRTLSEIPAGAVVNKFGYIVHCPEFVKDDSTVSTIFQLALKYKITLRTYFRIKSKLNSIFTNITEKDMSVFLKYNRENSNIKEKTK